MNISILLEYLNKYDGSLSINHLFLLKPDSFLNFKKLTAYVWNRWIYRIP